MQKYLKTLEVKIKNNRNSEIQKNQMKLESTKKKFDEKVLKKLRKMEEMYNV